MSTNYFDKYIKLCHFFEFLHLEEYIGLETYDEMLRVLHPFNMLAGDADEEYDRKIDNAETMAPEMGYWGGESVRSLAEDLQEHMEMFTDILNGGKDIGTEHYNKTLELYRRMSKLEYLGGK